MALTQRGDHTHTHTQTQEFILFGCPLWIVCHHRLWQYRSLAGNGCPRGGTKVKRTYGCGEPKLKPVARSEENRVSLSTEHYDLQTMRTFTFLPEYICTHVPTLARENTQTHKHTRVNHCPYRFINNYSSSEELQYSSFRLFVCFFCPCSDAILLRSRAPGTHTCNYCECHKKTTKTTVVARAVWVEL